MTDVDLLREAGRLIRERAEAAQPGPWRTLHNSDDQSFVQDHRGLFGAELHVSSGYYMDLAKTRGTAIHIASWHPAVALAVADWLEQAADEPTLVMFGEPEFDDRALAVATTYLGRPVTPAAAPDPAASSSGAAGSTQPPVRPAAEEDTGRTGHHTQRPSCS